MIEALSEIGKLLPEIAIAVIFAYLMSNMNKQTGDAHKEKTIAFTKAMNDQRDSFMSELKDIRGENREDREKLRHTIYDNTETMKNVLSVLREK